VLKEFKNLHGIGCRALSKVIGDDPHQQTVLDAIITTDSSDVYGIGSISFCGCWVDAVLRLITHNNAG
jgi:hypothetical protein